MKTPFNPWAFPQNELNTEGGMSLRDYFAAAALKGILANHHIFANRTTDQDPMGEFSPDRGILEFDDNHEEAAASAYAMADAMLAERLKEA